MLKELISRAQCGDKEAMQILICKFDPLLQKYARKLEREDSYEDLVLKFIELIHSIKLKNFVQFGDGVFTSYIQVSVVNCYKKILEDVIKEKQMICLSDLSDEQKYYIEMSLSKYDERNILNELGAKEILNRKEYEILYMIYFYGYNSANIAKITNKTRQAINQTKKRALKKLKHYFFNSLADPGNT